MWGCGDGEVNGMWSCGVLGCLKGGFVGNSMCVCLCVGAVGVRLGIIYTPFR